MQSKDYVGVKFFGVVKSKIKIATETRRSLSYYFSVFSAPPWLIFFVKNQTILQFRDYKRIKASKIPVS